MSFTSDEIRSNQQYFIHKLQAEKQRTDVLKAVDSGKFDFVLLDTLGREAFVQGHIPSAWCLPPSELEQVTPLLPRDKELVTYCWGHD
jgi:rhodanese-related sulfurtransferase